MFSRIYTFNEHSVKINIYLQGSDLIVHCFGGDKPHIGAIAVAVPRPSMVDPKIMSATTSVYTLTGHKDDIIAVSIAKKIAAAMNSLVVAIVGIHIEGIKENELKKLLNAIDYWEQEIITTLVFSGKKG